MVIELKLFLYHLSGPVAYVPRVNVILRPVLLLLTTRLLETWMLPRMLSYK
jgi:hypothetical protein